MQLTHVLVRSIGVAAAIALLVGCGKGDSSSDGAMTLKPDAEHGVVTGISLGYDLTGGKPTPGDEELRNDHSGRVGAFDSDRHLVAKMDAKKDGRFAFSLAPGTYLVTPYKGNDEVQTPCDEGKVVVTASTSIDIGERLGCVTPH